MEIVRARKEDHARLMSLYNRCKDDLNGRGIYQWNEKYPNDESVARCIESREQYLLVDGDQVVGTVVLNETQADEWKEVEWQFNDTVPCAVHGLVVDPEKQGRGYGKKVLKTCEDFAREKGYAIMRLDVFPENRAAVGLYEKSGFVKRGAVQFDYKPVGHQEYHCYEKQL